MVQVHDSFVLVGMVARGDVVGRVKVVQVVGADLIAVRVPEVCFLCRWMDATTKGRGGATSQCDARACVSEVSENPSQASSRTGGVFRVA